MSITYIVGKQKTKYNPSNIKKKIVNILDSQFKITLIKLDYKIKIDNFSNDYYNIPIFGYDDTYRLVLFEIREDKFGPLISKSFIIIDYIKNNQAKMKVLLSEHLDKETLGYLNFHPRIIVIGEDFFKEDFYGLKQMPYEVDLIKGNFHDDIFILEKSFASFNDLITTQVENELFNNLHTQIKEIDDVITATIFKNFISYRHIKNFCLIIIQDASLYVKLLFLNPVIIEVKNVNNINKVIKLIKENYDK